MLPRRDLDSAARSARLVRVAVGVPARARQAGRADAPQSRRGRLLRHGAVAGARRRPRLHRRGRRSLLRRVPVPAGQQPHPDERRRLAHGVVRQAVRLLAVRGAVRAARRRARHAVLQQPAAGGDGVDGRRLPAAAQRGGDRRALRQWVLRAVGGLRLRVLAAARSLQHGGGVRLPVPRPAARRRGGRAAAAAARGAARGALRRGAGARGLQQADARGGRHRAAVVLLARTALAAARGVARRRGGVPRVARPASRAG